ncbi:hypothetical protein CTRI78_v005716 [Colletotrichum trifolii]|uniref:Uncharacterized protein n=1 Tax=Colletotrichum trifolii TaxID=5466 RepID=A0A4R8RE15_COLTR|nr:hypothetical protein CTRI78_v005716 [Colletotrichum trifolii]
MASRRRNKGGYMPRGADRQGANTLLPASTTTANLLDHMDNPGNGDTIDHLASDLLENTMINRPNRPPHPNGLASHPTVLFFGPEATINEPARSTNSVMTSGDVTGAPATKQIRRQPSEVLATPPNIPRKSSRRKNKRTKLSDLSVNVGLRTPKRPLPMSKTSMVGGVQKQNAFLASSTTAPLGVVCKNVDSSHQSSGDDPEVRNKVNAMLAATQALKPRGAAPASHRKSPRNRRKKVASKLRQAFEFFQPKQATPPSKIRGKISGPIAVADCTLPNPASFYHLEDIEPASPASSIQRRINEGQNLGSNKVRSVVGGRKARNPVPGDESSESGSGSVDPFSEPFPRPPTPFEHRLKISSDSIPLMPVTSPFDAEAEFDVDLDGLLAENPVCASTPRARGDTRAAPEESPSYRYAGRGDRYLYTVKEGSDISSVVGRPKLTLDRDALRLFHDPEPITKKHPSPSKDELFDLEEQFREFCIDQIRAAPVEEQPGLLSKFHNVVGPNALGPRDANALLKSNANEAASDDFSTAKERKYTRDESNISMKHSRIPRPVELLKPRSTPRFGTQRLPRNADAMDLDELQ